MPDSHEHLAAFEKRAAGYSELKRSGKEIVSELLDMILFLEGSQYEVVQTMVANGIWKGHVPPDPKQPGDLEFGLIPHWLDDPPDFIKKVLAKHEWLQDIWNVLSWVVPSTIDEANYDRLVAAVKDGGVIANDGTFYGEGQYEQLDKRWLWSLVNYLFVRFTKDKADFSDKQVAPIPMQGSAANRVTVALLGDWGTGPFESGEAIEVMAQITAMKPDYLVHLGDVYYAGTAGDFQPPNEEQRNFLDYWPTPAQQKPGTSFTLNSNHEMYSGAKGYFDVALADSRFAAQQGTSYFALQYGGWTLLGLDSAYYSTSPLCMVGNINEEQAKWIRGLGVNPNRVIVLSHHNGLTYDGATEPTYPKGNATSFAAQVGDALGGDPAAWYWGHIHNGIVYKTPTVTGRKTLARCLGHAALPFGEAWGIKKNPGHVAWFADTNAGGKRVKNGFAVLSIDSGGAVTEDFYEQGNPKPVFTNQYAPSA